MRKREVMPRQAFERVAKDNACQLHFPYPGSEIVLLRSGVLQHLTKHMQVQSTPLTIPKTVTHLLTLMGLFFFLGPFPSLDGLARIL